jgi:hypothetical protein
MFWKDFKKHKPKKKGWYQCTIVFLFTDDEYQTYVMDLFYDTSTKKWIDNRRQSIFDTYEVLCYDGTRLYTSKECDRTDEVVAWRKIPKPYKRKGYKYYK